MHIFVEHSKSLVDIDRWVHIIQQFESVDFLIQNAVHVEQYAASENWCYEKGGNQHNGKKQSLQFVFHLKISTSNEGNNGVDESWDQAIATKFQFPAYDAENDCGRAHK